MRGDAGILLQSIGEWLGGHWAALFLVVVYLISDGNSQANEYE